MVRAIAFLKKCFLNYILPKLTFPYILSYLIISKHLTVVGSIHDLMAMLSKLVMKVICGVNLLVIGFLLPS